MSVDSLDNSKLMALFVDDYSEVVMGFPIYKSEIVYTTQRVIALAMSSEHKVCQLRSDNAKKFLSKDRRTYVIRITLFTNIRFRIVQSKTVTWSDRIERLPKWRGACWQQQSQKTCGAKQCARRHIFAIEFRLLDWMGKLRLRLRLVRKRMSRIFAFLEVARTCTSTRLNRKNSTRVKNWYSSDMTLIRKRTDCKNEVRGTWLYLSF